MRVLFDEMLDRRPKRYLPDGTEAPTARERGPRTLRNGELPEAARHEFDVLITTDRGIPHQQNLSRLGLAVVILRANSDAAKDLSFYGEGFERPVRNPRPGQVIRVGD